MYFPIKTGDMLGTPQKKILAQMTPWASSGDRGHGEVKILFDGISKTRKLFAIHKMVPQN